MSDKQFFDYIQKESKGEHTEFRMVVNQGKGYIHVLNRDSETFDFDLNQYSTPQEGRGRYVELNDVNLLTRAFQERKELTKAIGELDGIPVRIRTELAEIIERAFTNGTKYYRDQIFTSPPEIRSDLDWMEGLISELDIMDKAEDYASEQYKYRIDDIFEALKLAFFNGSIFYKQKLDEYKPSPPRSVGDKKEEV